MLTLEEVRKRLADCNLRLVADKAGVNRNSVYRMMRGEGNPSYETVKRLSDYLIAKQ